MLFRLISVLLLIALCRNFNLLTHHKLCIRTLTCSCINFLILEQLALLFKCLNKIWLRHISMLRKIEHLCFNCLIHTLCVNLRLLVFKYCTWSLFRPIKLRQNFEISNLWHWASYYFFRFCNFNFNFFRCNWKIFLFCILEGRPFQFYCISAMNYFFIGVDWIVLINILFIFNLTSVLWWHFRRFPSLFAKLVTSVSCTGRWMLLNLIILLCIEWLQNFYFWFRLVWHFFVLMFNLWSHDWINCLIGRIQNFCAHNLLCD